MRNHKIFYFILVAVLIISSAYSAFALSEEDYAEMINDSAFAEADRILNQSWALAKKSLPKDAFDELKKSQREWSKTLRDEEAEELMDVNGYSKLRAYTVVTQNRADEIQGIIESFSPEKKQSKKSIPEAGIVGADKDYITVIAKGTGTDRNSALSGAWTDAVRIAVGMIISSTTELNNDAFNENIIAHSRGSIENFDILDESIDDGLVQVVIQAKVKREILNDVTKTQMEAQTVEADTEAVAEVKKEQMNAQAKSATIKDKQKTGVELLKEVLESYGPENFFSATLDPKIKFSKDKKPYIQVNEKFNQDVFWKEFLPKLRQALDGVATNKIKDFYADNVRKANQKFPKQGFVLHGGIVDNVDMYNNRAYYRDSKTNKEVWVYLPYYVENLKGNSEVYRIVIPNDNASFRIYEMPFKNFSFLNTQYLSELYKENYTVEPNDSITEEGAAMILAVLKFIQRMSLPVTYEISYLDKDGEVITNQIVRTGPRAFGIYRSFSSGQDLRSRTLIFAPGFVNGSCYGINEREKMNLFLGTGNYNKAHSDEGYEVELDTEELEQLSSMKFEVIFEKE